MRDHQTSRNLFQTNHISAKNNAGCRSEYVPNPSRKYGALQDNGTFNGMIGMLERGEVDGATDGFALISSRAKVADPLTPIGSFK